MKVSLVMAEDRYLRLEQLGTVLQQLSQSFPGSYMEFVYQSFSYSALSAAVNKRRRLSDLKRGQPHLLVVPPDQVMRAALSLYMEDSNLPMPTPEEMLICNQHTTAEEVPSIS